MLIMNVGMARGVIGVEAYMRSASSAGGTVKTVNAALEVT